MGGLFRIKFLASREVDFQTPDLKWAQPIVDDFGAAKPSLSCQSQHFVNPSQMKNTSKPRWLIEIYAFLQNLSIDDFRMEFLSATNSLFRPLARNLTPRPPPSFCHPRCRGKKVSLETFFDNPPGQEAYHALKISRIYLPPSFCYSQSIPRDSCSFGDILYRIPIFYFRFVRGLGSFFRHVDLLRVSPYIGCCPSDIDYLAY